MKMINTFINKSFFRKHSHFANTIYALSSGQGKCGVAVVRVSGPKAGKALKDMTHMKELPKPRVALLRKICHPITKDLLDRGLILWFPSPQSFTGEDCCEFHIHGSVAVLSAVLNALGKVPGLRPAEAGEFTRQAFHSGKLDLTEVEGLSDLLQAETDLQRKQALLQTEGVLSDLYAKWRKILMKSVADIEAHIDFDETETLENNLLNDVAKKIYALEEDINRFLADGCKGEILRSGVKTTIIGEPNVGKSSLFNILCNKPAAIVTPIEGTTRDLLERTIDVNGYPLILTDTAGLRKTTGDIIEKEGINRAIKAVTTSDFVILIFDVSKFLLWKTQFPKNKFSAYLQTSLEIMNLEETTLHNCNHMIVINKSDLVENKIIDEITNELSNVVFMSCRTRHGIENFTDILTEHLKSLCGVPSKEHPCVMNERHHFLLNSCAKQLHLFIDKSKDVSPDFVLMAQNLRSALRDIGKITGHVTTEELLDIIFRDFCIGK